MFLPTLNGSGDASDFEWRAIFHRFLIFTPLCFITLGLIRFLFYLPTSFYPVAVHTARFQIIFDEVGVPDGFSFAVLRRGRLAR